ncbi:hypothetical protein KY320_02805 [Candidatus Woesearchaeota archaeon]|nr:hypothetical protein [Candidatus Woesearchaeota archaeon]
MKTFDFLAKKERFKPSPVQPQKPIQQKPKPKEESYGEVDNVNPAINKKQVQCIKCGFRFKANFATKTPRACPYCGRAYFNEP